VLIHSFTDLGGFELTNEHVDRISLLVTENNKSSVHKVFNDFVSTEKNKLEYEYESYSKWNELASLKEAYFNDKMDNLFDILENDIRDEILTLRELEFELNCIITGTGTNVFYMFSGLEEDYYKCYVSNEKVYINPFGLCFLYTDLQDLNNKVISYIEMNYGDFLKNNNISNNLSENELKKLLVEVSNGKLREKGIISKEFIKECVHGCDDPSEYSLEFDDICVDIYQ
jgi:hypothetical protein